jgi:hypothetical protein
MISIKKAIWMNAISAFLFLVGSMLFCGSFLYLYPRSTWPELSIEVQDKIKVIQNIENLREVALKLDNALRTEQKNGNELLEATFIFILAISFFAGITLLINVGLWLKLLREQRGQNVPWWLKWWLKWL